MRDIKRYLFMLLIIGVFNASAWSLRVEFEAAAIRALQDKGYLVSDDFRTNLLELIDSPIDEESRFEARVVQSHMNNEQYLHDMDLGKLLREYAATTNFAATVQIPTNSWCAWGIPLAVGAYSANLAEYEQAFNLTTNMIDKIMRGEIGGVTNRLSQAYVAAQLLEDTQPLQTFKTLAVVSEVFAFHELARTATYTNNVPPCIMNTLQEILEN